MGLTKESILMMCYCDNNEGNKVDFKQSVMIGRQNIHFKFEEAYSILKRYDNELFDKNFKYIDNIFKNDNPWGEALFKYFGAEIIDSLDYTDYEGANIVHDLNIPINNDLKNKYSLVWDSGTLEHVFNVPIALKNYMELVKINGHLVLEVPGNNCFGHGFYQFSPDLFFSILNEDNGFTDTKVFIRDDSFNYYEVISPIISKKRTDFCVANYSGVNCVVISKKIDQVPNDLSVFQSAHVNAWEENQSINLPGKESLNFKKFLYKLIPNQTKPFALFKFNYYFHKKDQYNGIVKNSVHKVIYSITH
jgi:hypothetical protein